VTAPVQVFDFRSEPVQLKRGQWAEGIARDPESQRGVVMHSWGTKVGTTIANRRKYGSEAEALARRALAATYLISAGVTSTGIPVVVLAHPVERYTFASDAANRDWTPIGVMGLFPAYERNRTLMHSVVTDALRAAVDTALFIAAAECLGGREGLDLIAHRQACNQSSDHFACCTEAVARMVCESEAVAQGLFIPRPDITLHELSRPWKPDWRRHIVQRSPPVTAVLVPDFIPPAEVDDADDLVARFG
jgi:pimeloyl-ACP methyl ester carboxylesterase